MAADTEHLRRLSELEAQLRASREAAQSAALVAERACARLERYEPVIKAARSFVEDPTHVNRLFELDEAVSNLASAEAKVPQA